MNPFPRSSAVSVSTSLAAGNRFSPSSAPCLLVFFWLRSFCCWQGRTRRESTSMLARQSVDGPGATSHGRDVSPARPPRLVRSTSLLSHLLTGTTLYSLFFSLGSLSDEISLLCPQTLAAWLRRHTSDLLITSCPRGHFAPACTSARSACRLQTLSQTPWQAPCRPSRLGSLMAGLAWRIVVIVSVAIPRPRD